ncbi:MAG: hypothetical protein A2694_01410 [Candidatus Blackburnbacteria bacterium RIFCSPHIGHO2_01_FULL_40_17]|uniref:Uncharacterized protein n=1 Tax=Candidatus Blackburnbacteria bacterium RIFCSPLOWO2_01_FULL_40_20 TaxID=1797519 RepID=A0A1G1VEY8_9BACT|nr:MAG: hypothetical protein A2694_01410 [Candidatus Blackburnbacteria bacterium RIFCSPHIGHO2_01_FULL_40_17]OGY13931.1 MAG: hypothetical protein A3A77_04000 [Candidatus Blackburnbacteria bacterium RIFCSPLOWO2_01_FULL_40_20]
MSSTQFWTGMLIPPFIKWVNPYLKKFFKLTEFDSEIKAKVFNKTYPASFNFLYSLWIITLLSTGFTVLIWFMISGSTLFAGKSYAVPVFLGLINMIGVWFIAGAMLNFVFWQISSENFRDYIKFRQIKSGWGFDIKQQIITLFKIGIIYYLVTSPFIVYLLIR